MILTIALAVLCLTHGIVEGTYGPYSRISSLYGSQYGNSNNGWSKLENYGNLYSGLSSYDTLNSQYSHALYPIGYHQYLRIPVKGGLTVVPAPKNLGYSKGFSSYETPYESHIPLIKTPPLSYFSSVYNTESKYLKGSPFPSYSRVLSSHSLSDGEVLKESPLSSYSSSDLSDLSHLTFLRYKPLKSIKSVKVIEGHGFSNPSPLVKVHKKVVTPVVKTISSYHENPKVHVVKHTKLAKVVHEDTDKHVLPISHHNIDIGHELPISHHNIDSGHELPISHDSGIRHQLTHLHDSDIHHEYQPVSFIHSGYGIHGSGHALLHDHHDSHEVLEDYDGHHTSSFHGAHIEEHQDDDDDDEEIVDNGKDYEAHPKHEDDEDDKEPENDYSNQEHVDDVPTAQVGKDNKKTTYEQKEVKTSEPSYIQQKKTEVTSIQHEEKDEYKSIQSEEYESKGYEKPSLSARHPVYEADHYPQFPQLHKKLESYDKVKYAGGRYPIRPLKQSFYEIEQKSEEPVAERHPTYEQPKVEQQAHDEYKAIPEVDHEYEQRQTYVQPPKRTHYKSGSSQPRGRSKIYRNYQMPRTSSYEIEILHSESRENAKDSPSGQYSQDNYQHDSYADTDRAYEEDGHQSFTQEVSNDEQDSFDYQESQNSPVEVKDPEQESQE